MSRFSPTVLPQPDGAGAAIAQGLANGFQNFLAIRNAREGRLRQQQQDTERAKQQQFENALRMRQIQLQEQTAQRQREQQARENAQAGYTPASDMTVDLGPLGQALAGQAGGVGVTGAVLQQMPETTLHTPASYDPTRSQAYAVARAGREAQATQDAARLAETVRHNKAMEQAATMRARRPLGSGGRTPADPRVAELRYITGRVAQLTKDHYDPRLAKNVPGLSPEAAAQQAQQEFAASSGMVYPPNGGYVVPAERTSGRPVIRGGDNARVSPAPRTTPQPTARVQPETQPVSPDAAYTRAVTKQAQDAIALIDGSGGRVTPLQAMHSPNLTDEAKAILMRHYRLTASDTTSARGGAGR